MADDEIRRRIRLLIEGARQRSLQEFERAVAKGERNPQAELAEYQRRRRDYASWQRMGEAAPEARDLARKLAAHPEMSKWPMSDTEMESFALEVNAMLIDLYDQFIIRAR